MGSTRCTCTPRASRTWTVAWQGASSAAAGTEFVLQVAGVREAVTVSAPGGYQVPAITTATKTPTPLLDVPQSVTVVTSELIKDQMMMSVGDVMRYVPGVTVHQGENNRDQVIIRGNSSSADFFVDGVRDDVQYYRDLYNLDRVEALKGPNAMIFGRGGAGGVVNRVSREAGFRQSQEISLQGGMFGNKRVTAGFNEPLNDKAALRLDGMYENSDSFRNFVGLERYGLTPTATIAAGPNTKVTLRYEYLKDTRTADRGITSFQGLPATVDPETFYGNPDLSDVRANVNVASGLVEHRTHGITIRNRTVLGNYDRFYQNFVPGAATADQSQVALTSYNNATNRTNFFNQTDVTSIVSTGRVRHTLLAGAEFGHQLTDNFRNTGYFNNTATSMLVPFAAPTIYTPVTYRQSATDADNHLTTNVAAAYAQDQIELAKQLQVVGGLRFDRFDLTYHNNRNNDTLNRPDNLVSPRAGIVYKPAATGVDLQQLQRVLSPQLRRSVLVADGHHRAGEARAVHELRGRRQVGCRSQPVGHDGGLPPGPHEYALDRSQRSDAHRADRQPADQRLRAGRQRSRHAAVEHRGRLYVSGRLCHQRDDGCRRGPAGRAGAAPHGVAVEQLSVPSARRRRPRHRQPHRDVRGDRQHRPAARLYAGGCGRFREADAAAAPAAERGKPVRQGVLHQRGQQHQHLAGIPADGAGRPDRDVLVPEVVSGFSRTLSGPSEG